MNLDQLRLCHLPDIPTLYPIPDWSPKPRSYIPVEFDKLVNAEERFDKKIVCILFIFMIILLCLNACNNCYFNVSNNHPCRSIK